MDKSLFIEELPDQEGAAKWEFDTEGLHINIVGGSWYLGVYLGPREKLEAWVKP